MKTTEMVMDFLRKQGFCPEVDGDNGNIIFKYQMSTFVFFNNDEDEEFFQLAYPNIYEVNEENRELVLEAANKVNRSLKVTKIIIVGDRSIWAVFENLLDLSPEVNTIIPRALVILQHARQAFYEALQ